MKIEDIRKVIDTNSNFRALSSSSSPNEETITVNGVAITANYIDYHGSMFTRSCLEESLNEFIIHNADHERTYRSLISNDVIKSIEVKSIRELGEDRDGQIDAFVFKSTFSKEDNEDMFREYSRGRVKFHSIEFDWSRRSNEIICVNSTYNTEQKYKDNWEKYYPSVINKEVADKRGWFYVYERAPIIAISAVVIGSNKLTPTLSARGLNNISFEDIRQVSTKKTLIDEFCEIIANHK